MALNEQEGTYDMAKLLDYLINLLGTEFSRDVTSVYFGDIGTYPPSAFGASRKDTKCVLVLIPLYNRLKEGTRVAISENRLLGVRVVALVNITPFQTASPPEAYGERILVDLATRIQKFLTQATNETLGKRAVWTTVGDIDWTFQQRGDLSLRAAAIEYEMEVRVFRQ